MKSSELLKKCGYKKRYNDSHCVIYDLEKNNPSCNLPDTFIIDKGNFGIEFATDYIEEHTHLGTFSFNISNEFLQALNQKIEELKIEK